MPRRKKVDEDIRESGTKDTERDGEPVFDPVSENMLAEEEERSGLDLSRLSPKELLEVLGKNARTSPAGVVYAESDQFRFLFSRLSGAFKWVIVTEKGRKVKDGGRIISPSQFLSDSATKSDPVAKDLRRRLREFAKASA